MTIGILAVQGAFIEHINVLKKLNINTVQIKKEADLHIPIAGLILPGGESTVMSKLLNESNMLENLRQRIKNGLPVFGTCAGMILLAKEIENDVSINGFATMDICVVRNGYGRQLGSFNAVSNFSDNVNIEMPFIRAPFIKSSSPNVEILAVVDGKIVAARQKNQLVTAFHPELTSQLYIHNYFLGML